MFLVFFIFLWFEVVDFFVNVG